MGEREIIHLDTEEYLQLGHSIEFTSLPLKACVTQGLWQKYETKVSQFSFTCNYARMRLVSIIPRLCHLFFTLKPAWCS